MRKFVALILVCMALLSACSSSSLAVNPANYSKIEELALLPSGGIAGISPDGRFAYHCAETDISAYSIDIKPGDAKPSFEPQLMLQIDKGSVLFGKKKLQWSGDGRSFIFSDIGYPSLELIQMTSRNISLFSLQNGSLAVQSVTNEDTKLRISAGTGHLIYAPSFSYDGKGIVYSALGADSSVFKVDLASGEKKTIYTMSERRDIDCLELGNGLSICCINSIRANEACRLFFVDGNGSITNITDKALGLDNGLRQFDVKEWSGDRRTLLLTRRDNEKAKGIMDAVFIVKAGGTSTNYQIKPYPLDEGKIILNAALSPDGSFMVCLESTLSSDSSGPSMKDLMLYDIATEKKTSLYSSSELFGVSSPLNGNLESIYVTNNGRLLIWFSEGYKLFQLK